MVPGRIGILRASSHQCDPKYFKYAGQQSLANAVAAAVMLRVYQSKYWTFNILNIILNLGETIHNTTLQSLKSTEETQMKVTNIIKRISLDEREYRPEIEEISAMGKLGSNEDNTLDLPEALREFFSDNDGCIIRGPVELGVWFERDLYYMWDPNERDEKGLVIEKDLKLGSELRVLDYEPGLACLTWFTELEDLVEVYMKNVPKIKRRDWFVLSKIQIHDYVELPDAWYNFKCKMIHYVTLFDFMVQSLCRC